LNGCHSCRLCDLACSAWRFSRDGECAPRAIVLMDQRRQDVTVQQIAHCTLCGACDAACPIGLRPMRTIMQQGNAGNVLETFSVRVPKTGKRLLLSPDHAVSHCFPDSQWVGDCGADIVAAFARSAHVDPQRLQHFIAPLTVASQVIVADGLLYNALRSWLPEAPLVTLAEALLPKRHHHLREDDLLLLDAPAFNADRERLLPIVQQAVHRNGAMLSLDLQRLAMPLRSYRPDEDAALRARWQWLSQHRTIARIITENPAEADVAAMVSGLPAIWLGELEAC